MLLIARMGYIMHNDKLQQRYEIIYEYGLLVKPIEELLQKKGEISASELRCAIVLVEPGIRAWQDNVVKYAKFSQDLFYRRESQEINKIPVFVVGEMIKLVNHTEKINMKMGRDIHVELFDKRKKQLFKLLETIPIEWGAEILETNTPFTTYMKLRNVIATTRKRLHYFDRYLNEDFFDLFLRHVNKDSEIILITTKNSVDKLISIAQYAKTEYPELQMVQVSPSDMHDRNIRVDDNIFVLGNGIDSIGKRPMNFGISGNSAADHFELDTIIKSGTVKV